MDTKKISLCYIIFAHHPFSESNRTLNFKIKSKRITLCARCTGKYIGLLSSIILFALAGPVKISLSLIFLLPLPATIDWITQTMKLRESFNLLRVATGLLYGFWVGLFLQAIIAFNWSLIGVMTLQVVIYASVAYILYLKNPVLLFDYVKLYEDFIAEYKRQKNIQSNTE